MIDKNKLKNNLSLEQVYDYVNFLGGDPKKYENFLVCHTICHNPPHTGSYKLYYYDDSKLFKCYTECDDAFDIFELTYKVKKLAQEDISFKRSIYYVANFFGQQEEVLENMPTDKQELSDWSFFKEYQKNNEYKEKIVELKHYDEKILAFFPQPRILSWEKEFIKYPAIKKRNIKYNPINLSVLIPHYDMYNNLIGIRERTLIKENEINGKYKPAVLNKVMYNHPLSFALYNLNNSKDNIRKMKKVIIFEGEKGCLQFASLFGEEQDISVACCGSSLTDYQIKLLVSLGVEEIIIGFDKQFKEIGDEEFKQWKMKLIKLHNKYKTYATISFLFDKFNLLKYKESPTDEGAEKFIKLFKERIIL